MRKEINFTSKKALIEVLEDITRHLKTLEEEVTMTWGRLKDEDGNDVLEPKTRYNRDTHELEDVLDEDGNQVFEPSYGSMPKPKDEYSDNDRAKLEAIEVVYNALVKLV